MQTGLAKQIGRWRRVNLIKQSRLAAELGVSQQAVSAWERGLALPSQQVLARLRTMMHDAEPLPAECAALKGQSTVRALIDTDGARLLEYSSGFERRWSDFCCLKGECLEGRLVNERAVTLGARTLWLTNAGETFSGVISGTGGFAILAGTETLTGTNIHEGVTGVAADARLNLSGAGSIAHLAEVAIRGLLDVSGAGGATDIRTLSGDGAVDLGAQTRRFTAGSRRLAGARRSAASTFSPAPSTSWPARRSRRKARAASPRRRAWRSKAPSTSPP